MIMVHPDYQYTPKLIPAMVSMIANGLYPCVIGSRILGNYALRGGMLVIAGGFTGAEMGGGIECGVGHGRLLLRPRRRVRRDRTDRWVGR